jgi:hypothetical protein
MSRYGRGSDDGTFGMGLLAAVMAIGGIFIGYSIRDSGYVFNATQTPNTTEIQK